MLGRTWLFLFPFILTLTPPLCQAGQGGAWKESDRVLAVKSGDVYWYPGTVLSKAGKDYEVLFEDDGHKETVPATRIVKNDIGVKSEVFVRWKKQPIYYFGSVAKKEGERLLIHYDDGDEEWTTTGMLKAVRGKIAALCKPGQHVLAPSVHPFLWYPGVIGSLMDGRARIIFLDGEQLWAPFDQVASFSLKKEDKVLAHWKGGATLYSGTVRQVDGEEVQIDYDDGDAEKASVKNLVFPLDARYGLGSRGACVKTKSAEPAVPDLGPSDNVREAGKKGKMI